MKDPVPLKLLLAGTSLTTLPPPFLAPYRDLRARLNIYIISSRIFFSFRSGSEGRLRPEVFGILIFCWRANARSAESLRVGEGVPPFRRHFRRHRLYDRRIYTIVGLYTGKLLTYAAVRTYVRTYRA